jgi:hypothetical protein
MSINAMIVETRDLEEVKENPMGRLLRNRVTIILVSINQFLLSMTLEPTLLPIRARIKDQTVVLLLDHLLDFRA